MVKEKTKNMTVNELIEELNAVKNKELHVYGWQSGRDIAPIGMVDELDDRVDLNLIDEDEA